MLRGPRTPVDWSWAGRGKAQLLHPLPRRLGLTQKPYKHAILVRCTTHIREKSNHLPFTHHELPRIHFNPRLARALPLLAARLRSLPLHIRVDTQWDKFMLYLTTSVLKRLEREELGDVAHSLDWAVQHDATSLDGADFETVRG